MTEISGGFDVVGIGNAIVDVLSPVDDALLDELGLHKGSMTLIDEGAARRIYGRMPDGVECSGGSAANTIAGLASFGARAAFIGKTRNDPLGKVFAEDIRKMGVTFRTPTASEEAPETARCLVLVTPDAQRTMGTFLGASVLLGPDDIDRELIKSAGITYLEGYLWDPPQAKEAFLLAMDIAHAAGNKVALSLSDPFCVARFRADFRQLAENHIDILFANEHEIMSLYETEDFTTALNNIRGRCEIAVLTRSEKGSVVVTADAVHKIPAHPVAQVVDTTGAGDLYAAGFLHGLTRGQDLAQCGRLASRAAAEVISHYGARPEMALNELAREFAAGV